MLPYEGGQQFRDDHIFRPDQTLNSFIAIHQRLKINCNSTCKVISIDITCETEDSCLISVEFGSPSVDGNSRVFCYHQAVNSTHSGPAALQFLAARDLESDFPCYNVQTIVLGVFDHTTGDKNS
jgi:hypothetical protein